MPMPVATLPGGPGGPAAPSGLHRPWRAVDEVASEMSEILIMGLVAIAVVIVMAGVLGRLVARDDMSYADGDLSASR